MPSKPRKMLFPRAIEREYIKLLEEVPVMIAVAVQTHVVPVLEMKQDAIDDIPESAGWFETLRQGFLKAVATIRLTPIEERVKIISDQVTRFNRRQFDAMLRKAYRVDIFKSEPWLADVLKNWEAENINLIRSIPQQSLDRMHGRIVAAVRRGETVRDLKAWIRKEYGVANSRAELIARDQIGKLNGQLTEERQTGIGVEKYKWRGALDERERDEHVIREGKVFEWDKPPPDGHPGEPIQCRCWAEPILPLLEDLEGLQFPDLTPARGDSLTKFRRKENRRQQRTQP